MKKPIKAALLSALVFPGVGHVFLKRYFSGAVLAGIALVALYVLVSNAVEKALDIVDKIQRGEIPPDIVVITELVSRQPMAAEAQLINMATLALIVAWLGGVADSYRVGWLQECNAGR